MNSERRQHILVAAYALYPTSALHVHPGEARDSWCLLSEAARYYEFTVLTRSDNRPGIEAGCKGTPLETARFVYLDVPLPRRWTRSCQIALVTHYYLWQIASYFVGRRLAAQRKFDFTWHLSFHNDWIPSFIGAFIPLPFILGPVGGGQRVPGPFLRDALSRQARIAEWARQVGQCLGRSHPIVRRRMFENACLILVCNRETLQKVPEPFRGKTHLFPVNGIAQPELDMVAGSSARHGNFRILSAGRLHPIKGFALGLRAFQVVRRQIPDAELVIAGEGPERKRLERLITDLGLQGAVKLVGWLDRRCLMEQMRSCDVFLFPSYRDGGGAVVIEAMAAGKPVVCFDLGGPALYVTEECGIKVPALEPSQAVREMSEALLRLAVSEDLRVRLGRAARARVQAAYTWEAHGRRFRELVSQAVISTARPSTGTAAL